MTPKMLLESVLTMYLNRYEKRILGATLYDRKTAKYFKEGVVRGYCASEK